MSAWYDFSAAVGWTVVSTLHCEKSFMTALQFYRRLLDLLQESGLSKAEKLEFLERAAEFVKEEAAVKAIWKPKPPKKPRGK